MNYVDRILVTLADDAIRSSVFDAPSLEQLLDAAYDTGDMGAVGPFTADFGDFRLGHSMTRLGSVEGTWAAAGGAERTEARFRLSGLADGTAPRVDAVWRGAIIARFRRGGEPIESVKTRTPNAETVEAEVTFAAPQSVSATPRPLPIAVALLIRDAAGFALSGLLAETKTIRDALAPIGLEQPPDPGLRLRRPLLVAWIVPPALFDDTDWPGATAGMSAAQQRAARRAAAGQWLAREGIGLVASP